ncbi:hypothetical protein F442_11685 [Phytophthora nicotianae P10297]|uniref:Uncharacterized protein n=1 Tax=Phytophthora nicotianae P10297 TaxID=1317064 RepID=W2Z202_PHYNI|nr:hypothetical protein F442_11685 [Phytophthora nicotianae P10297]
MGICARSTATHGSATTTEWWGASGVWFLASKCAGALSNASSEEDLAESWDFNSLFLHSIAKLPEKKAVQLGAPCAADLRKPSSDLEAERSRVEGDHCQIDFNVGDLVSQMYCRFDEYPPFIRNFYVEATVSLF